MQQRNSTVFTSHSETGRLFQSIDWKSHPLGPVKKWPSALRVSLSTLFHSKQPMIVMWGAELYQFYNDAAIPTIGPERHPHAMGQTGRKCWHELWHLVRTQFDIVMQQGGSTWNEDHLIPIFRNGRMENAYWTYSYTPLFTDDGTVGGLLAIINETTRKVEVTTKSVDERTRILKIFKKAPLPMIFLEGPNHKIKFANEAYEKLFFPEGITAAEYLEKDVSDLLPDLKTSGYVDILGEVYSTGQRHSGKETEFSFTKPDGTLSHGYYDYVYEPLFSADGQIDGILALVIDVTEEVGLRQKLEKIASDLAIERYKLEIIFHESPAAMALWRGEDFIFEKVNPQLQKYYSGMQLEGSSLFDLIPKEVDPFYTQTLKDVFYTGRPSTGKKQAAFTLNSEGAWEKRFFDFTYLQVKGQDGKPYGVFGHAVDVTEEVLLQKKVEKTTQDLLNERHILEAIFQRSPASMALWKGEELVFERLNPHYQNIFPNRLLKGQPLEVACPEIKGQEYPEMIRKVLQSGETVYKEEGKATLRDENGQLRDHFYDFAYIPISDPGGKPFGVYVHAVEVTEKVRYRQSLEAAKNEAEKANNLKSAFLANMSHEIRTPLGAILGFADILRNPTLSEKDRNHYLEVITRNGKALSKIIDDILDLSKIEAGKLEIEKMPLCLKELARDVVAMFVDRAAAKDVKLELDDGNFPQFLIASDPVRIRQVLVNLIGNAIKFTPKGSVRIEGEMLENDQSGVCFKIKVIDSGIGLTHRQAKKLFAPFTQADEKSSRQFGGTGLGLALSKKLGKALGGNVRLEEYRKNKGCTFSFSIKAKKSDACPETRLKEAIAQENREAKRLEGLKVLVVDDAIDNRNLIQIFLKREGAKVDLAADGETGVEMACKNNYDAVLMDIQMPGIDGYEALARLQDRHFDKPVIALTAHAFVEEKNRAMDAGFRDHLTKPISSTGLTDSILTHTRH